jgi:hypothetical protein
VVSVKRSHTHRRPSRVPADDAFRERLEHELRADARFLMLSPGGRNALLTAVRNHADGAGVFHISVRGWASEAYLSRRALQYAAVRCEVLGLLAVSTFSIGPGKQCSNTYSLDAALVNRARPNRESTAAAVPAATSPAPAHAAPPESAHRTVKSALEAAPLERRYQAALEIVVNGSNRVAAAPLTKDEKYELVVERASILHTAIYPRRVIA